jgi:hypothetical protein
VRERIHVLCESDGENANQCTNDERDGSGNDDAVKNTNKKEEVKYEDPFFSFCCLYMRFPATYEKPRLPL